jgi:hypothetical protein
MPNNAQITNQKAIIVSIYWNENTISQVKILLSL